MSANINQIYTTNPITSIADADLMYIGKSPFGPTDNAAIAFSDFKVQFVQASVSSFAQGAILFVNGSNQAAQDNSNLFWDDSNNRLGLGTASPSTRLTIDGKLALFDSGSQAENTGVSTESSGKLINIGTNDSSSNRFGGSYTVANQGGFFRVDSRTGTNLFEWQGRDAGTSGLTSLLSYMTSAGNFALSSSSLATTATDNFPYMPTCAGVPTGVPTSLSGLAPFVYDSSGNDLYIYNSGWQHIPTGSGAFTQGSVIFAGSGGVLSQDNAEFFWDNSNKRLGIGTASPSVELDITGDVLASGTMKVGNYIGVTGNATLTGPAAYVFYDRSSVGKTTFANQRGASAGGWEWVNYNSSNTLDNVAMTLTSSGDLAAISGEFSQPVVGNIELLILENSAGVVTGQYADALLRAGANQTFGTRLRAGQNGPSTNQFQIILGNGNSTTEQTFVTFANASGTQLTDFFGSVDFNGQVDFLSDIAITGTITAGTWQGDIIAPAYGGTGTSSVFTEGAVVFAGSSGVYTQNPANLFWDNSNARLGIQTSSPTVELDVDGRIGVYDTTKTINAGIATSANGALINIGLNDSSSNRFGGSYTSADQGGFFRTDSRSGRNLFEWYARVAGSTGGVGVVGLLTSTGDFSITGSVTGGTWEATTIGTAYGGTGTGTTFTQGSVVFAGSSGIYTEDNSNLFWDNSNKYLGIGTSTPSFPFEIVKSTGIFEACRLRNSGAIGTNTFVEQLMCAGSTQQYGTRFRSGAFNTNQNQFKIYLGNGNSTTEQLMLELQNFSGTTAIILHRDSTINGDLNITGSLSKGSGTFTIDHPLDPANKILQHSFVESPDMMNIYNGIVTLDANGEAVVTMPSYFKALNRDFRYQLTCLGAHHPVYISQEISNLQFKISGGQQGVKVSWQVTGIRQDNYAKANPIEVEIDKNIEQKNKYLHPAAFGLDESKAIVREVV